MDELEALRRLGLFVEPEFLSAEACADLRHQLRSAMGMKATVGRGQRAAIDERERRSSRVSVPPQTASSVAARFQMLTDRLARHFGIGLVGFEPPQFLIYRAGDFFAPHVDADQHPQAPPSVRARKVSAVAFLSDQDELGTGSGMLVLHGLETGPDRSRAARPIPTRTGLLVGFRGDIVHEVTPVRTGERFTVVTWFY